tara:strand:+ start:1652 stop:2041 length:390 start_codon:yes stop_codon:yes gene_type:complete
MRISKAIRAYSRAIQDASAKSYGIYEICYFNLDQKDKILASAIVSRLACRKILSRRQLSDRKNTTTSSDRADCVAILEIINNSQSNHLKSYIPLLKKISLNQDIYEDCGSSPIEIIRGIKRCIQSGALR